MPQLSDAEIAQNATIRPISEIAERLGISPDDLELYGKYKAKLPLSLIPQPSEKTDKSKRGKLILVTAINPTPAGEGKTTVTIGLADALSKRGHRTVIAMREPSLGPVFGVKGGAAGGGYAQVIPMEEINLHFTGDLHAIGAANNLLAALIDNHIFHGNELQIDPKRVTWRRVVDMNDRQLRSITSGLGGVSDGVARMDGFDITVASEIMAIFCLSENIHDLKERLGNIVIGYRYDKSPVYARELKAEGAMAALLKNAIKPNLVQTLEGTPALVHGGPFANIAHGCNSVLATKMALALSEYTVTEAGFGADLGAEKFCNIKCREAELVPDAAVVVATIRALKYNGGVSKFSLNKENIEALKKGCANLIKHVRNMNTHFGIPVVVGINRFVSDSKEELHALQEICQQEKIPVALVDVWGKGGKGGDALVDALVSTIKEMPSLRYTYDVKQSIEEKIEAIAKEIYGADGVDYTPAAKRTIKQLKKHHFDRLPVCMAKTQYSFSDNKALLGQPTGFRITVRDLAVSNGAGFIVVMCGDIMKMPGLPKEPAAMTIDVDDETGHIQGLF